jgi:peptide-methionine (R)-S-oxide reductase
MQRSLTKTVWKYALLFLACTLGGCNREKNSYMKIPAHSPGEEDCVAVRLLGISNHWTRPLSVKKVTKSDAQWKMLLTPEQYRITRRKGTEAAFCGQFYDNKKTGLYSCVCCRLPLFASNAKFDSGTGWPSFFAPVARENIQTEEDRSYGMDREEILCRRCHAHLGHVFDDGPPPSGLRYCLNSDSLAFTEMAVPDPNGPLDTIPAAPFDKDAVCGEKD